MGKENSYDVVSMAEKNNTTNKIDVVGGGALLDGFSPVSSTRIDWKSRKRSGT